MENDLKEQISLKSLRITEIVLNHMLYGQYLSNKELKIQELKTTEVGKILYGK